MVRNGWLSRDDNGNDKPQHETYFSYNNILFHKRGGANEIQIEILLFNRPHQPVVGGGCGLFLVAMKSAVESANFTFPSAL